MTEPTSLESLMENKPVRIMIDPEFLTKIALYFRNAKVLEGDFKTIVEGQVNEGDEQSKDFYNIYLEDMAKSLDSLHDSTMKFKESVNKRYQEYNTTIINQPDDSPESKKKGYKLVSSIKRSVFLPKTL